jgi:hypothetical protein
MPERTREWVEGTVIPVLNRSLSVDDAGAVLRVTRHVVKRALDKYGLGPASKHVGASLRAVDTGGNYARATVSLGDDGLRVEPLRAKGNSECASVRVADPLAAHVAKGAETKWKAERRELLDRLHEAETRASFVAEVRGSGTPRIVAQEKSSGMREAAAVLLASDWHVDECVHPASVAGRNEYSPTIAEQRVARFADGAAWLIENSRHGFIVSDVVLAGIGDLISGYIHEELEEDNPLSPVQGTVLAKALFAHVIRRLLADGKIRRIVVPFVAGNHGRTTPKRRIKTGWKNSYEWLAGTMLAEEFKNEPRVQFVIPEGPHAYADVYGRTLHFTHGDELKFGGGVGGLAIPLGKRVPAWNNVRRADVHCIGHFHTYRNFGHTIVNGSLIGYTDFAMAIGAEYEEPKQAFFLIDSKRGMSLGGPVWVDEPAKEAA